jgi:hypothetical protein
MLRQAFVAMGLLIPLAPPALAQPRSVPRDFTVTFANCSEFAGEGYVPLSTVQDLVPPGYTITATSPGNAPIVVRMTNCDTVQVEGAPAIPTTISQIGVNIVSPDATGTINNYMLLYVTNNPFLVRAFARAGVPTNLDPDITYQYTLNSAGTGGTLYGAVPHGGVAAYFLYGPETEPPPNSQEYFLANWWFGRHAQVRQQTAFPAISFGTSSVTLYTSKTAKLGTIIGGNAYNAFSVLALHGEYRNAQMMVSDSAND